jgi:hypothetical protein
MTALPSDNPQVRRVGSFQELVTVRFADGVNAFCWERSLPGDYGEVIAQLSASNSEPIVTLDETTLRGMSLSAAGRVAAEQMLADLRLLRDHALDPVLNLIHGYPRDEEAGPVPVDVFSFHADSAPVEADTFLCTYFGPASEGLRNEEARRRVDVPETRAALLAQFGGADNADFQAHLTEECYDLHYAPLPQARPFSFGLGNLWRLAIRHPESAVPPCIHRAPATAPGESRLLLIS